MNNKKKDSKKTERILTFLQNKANLTYNKYTSWLVKNYLVYKWNVSTRVSQYSIENCTGCLWRYIILAINTSPLSLTYDLKTNEDCKQELWGRTDVRWKFSCISYFRQKNHCISTWIVPSPDAAMRMCLSSSVWKLLTNSSNRFELRAHFLALP